ncbi:MAG: SDR family NAD(P)-dependent oxidoreductase [Elusimicrobiota bacterium]
MKKEKTAQPLAIIGIACRFPKADDLEAYWKNIKNGVDAIVDIPATHWNPEEYFNADPKKPDMTYGRRGGFLSPADFNPMEFGMAPRDIEATDTSQLLGMMAAQDALKDAGYGPQRDFDHGRTSVILGVTGALELVIPLGARLGHPLWRKAMREAGIEEAAVEDAVGRIADSYVGWQENSFPGLLGNVVAGRIANRLDLHGTNCVVDAACASSLSAIHLAGLELESGRSDMVVTGGVDTFNDIFMFTCFSKTPALSPTGDCRSFDASGDGTILGEGLGMVVLKRLADAQRDGDRIHAVIKGVGSSSDGKGAAIYEPSARGQSRALKNAYRLSGVSPDTVELVEAHGTGTKVGDATEVSALTEVYREYRREGTWCALGSVKSMIGHTKAASGSAGLIKAVLALKNKTLPPTLKVTNPNEKVAPRSTPFYVNTCKRPWLPRAEHPRRAALSALGFGGSNFHCVVEEYDAKKAAADWDGDAQIVAFSGRDAAGIDAALGAFPADLPWPQLRARAAESRADFAPQAPCRLLAVLEKDGDAGALLAQARMLLKKDPSAKSWSAPNGIYFGSGDAPGGLGLLFSGQGSQYTGMLRDLACQFPRMLDTLAEANDAVDCGGAERLSDLIYPPPTFNDEDKARDDKALRATQVAQPAIGAVSLGALRVLEDFAVCPQAAAGHSYGELSALCAAGRFDASTLFKLSELRGRLMGEGKGDLGSMLAVQAPIDQVEAAVEKGGFDLVLANKNAPSQVVLSGATGEIERAEKSLAEQGLRCKRLPVAAAFHSKLVAGAREPFAQALKDVAFKKSAFPVFANTSAEAYPDSAAKSRLLLAGQLACPVEFVREIENLYASGVRTFLEVGPGARLTGLVKAILEGKEFAAAAVDASGGKRSGIADLARALAQLAARGHAVALGRWDEGFALPERNAGGKAAFTVPLSAANYRAPRKAKPPTSRPRPAAAQPASAAPLTFVSAPAAAPAQGALLRTQEHLIALQRIQEQTALLHAKFLEGQEAALKTIQTLISGEQAAPAGTPIPAAAPAVPAAVSVPVPAAAPAVGSGQVEAVLLAVVSEKTGYPVEMLNLDMGLDSDLGIDSIKRVEILSSLQEKLPGAPTVKPDQLGTLRTLRQVVDFLTSGMSVAAPPAVDRGRVEFVLLSVVSEKTGYPAEMLNLDMGLDSDLGIDSIKRVEILSSLQEKLPGAPAVKPDQLGTLRTLRQVVDFLTSGMSAAAPAAAAGGVDLAAAEKVLLEVVAEKTGYPAEMLNLDMGLDSDLGIDSIKRVEILSAMQEKLPGAPAVRPDQLGTLRTLRQVAEFLSSGAPASAPPPAPTAEKGRAPARPDRPLLRQILQVVEAESERPELTLAAGAEIWLTEDGSELSRRVGENLSARGFAVKLLARADWSSVSFPERLGGLVIVAPCGAGDDFVKDSLFLLQQAGPALRAAGKSGTALFAAVTRFDGACGLREMPGDADFAAGALAGLAKTAGREWPEVVCRVLDVDRNFTDAADAARQLAGELLLTGPAEVGISPAGRTALRLERAKLAAGKHIPLSPDDVVLVTGGARGVTAETACALAKAFKPTLVLLGRSGAPTPEPDWLAGLESEGDIKKTLLSRAGSKLAPKELEERYRDLASNREMLRNIARMERSGATVLYRSLDVRDPDAVRALVKELEGGEGRVRGLIHGAGVLADRSIEDKTEEQFVRVYGTKIAGLRALWRALDPGALKILVLFSSTTARLGRSGQVDYAMANEALNVFARREARRLPGCRVLSVNWGPWEGGMVTPSLRKVFAQEGVGLIPLDKGADYLIAELRAGSGPTETVILGDGPAAAGSGKEQPEPPLTVVFERLLDVAGHPFLKSHVIDGRAVLPMALIVEWLAHGALHGNPGRVFHGFEELRIIKGVRLACGEKVNIRVLAGKAARADGVYRVPVELRSVPAAPGADVVHARGSIILGDRPLKAEPPMLEIRPQKFPGPTRRVYDDYLFHGEDLRGIREIEGCSPEGIVSSAATAPAPARWIKKPLRGGWIADPLALDAAFQLMIVWSFEKHGAGSLPCYAGRYRQFRSFPADGVRIVIQVTKNGNYRALADIEFIGTDGKLVARLEGYECVVDESLNEAFKRRALSVAAAEPA